MSNPLSLMRRGVVSVAAPLRARFFDALISTRCSHARHRRVALLVTVAVFGCAAGTLGQTPYCPSYAAVCGKYSGPSGCGPFPARPCAKSRPGPCNWHSGYHGLRHGYAPSNCWPRLGRLWGWPFGYGQRATPHWLYPPRGLTGPNVEESNYSNIDVPEPLNYYEHKWLGNERFSFNRLTRTLAREELYARRAKKKLSSRLANAIRYTNGSARPTHMAAFRSLVKQLCASSETSYLMQESVPPMDATDLGERRNYGIVKPDGKLKTPPLVLYGISPDDRRRKAALAFGRQWLRTVTKLRSKGAVAPVHIVQLDENLEVWSKASEKAIQAASRSDRSVAYAYLNGATVLIRALKDPQRSGRLTKYVRARELSFGGGSVGDLVEFLLDNDLSPPLGSHAQLVLARVGSEMEQNIRLQISTLEDRVERFKAQNPAHNGATKELLIGKAHSDRRYRASQESYVARGAGPYDRLFPRGSRYARNAGVPGDAPTYRSMMEDRTLASPSNENAGSGSPPSQFSFAQGEQPAGLQSRAYGRSLPRHTAEKRPRYGDLTAGAVERSVAEL